MQRLCATVTMCACHIYLFQDMSFVFAQIIISAKYRKEMKATYYSIMHVFVYFTSFMQLFMLFFMIKFGFKSKSYATFALNQLPRFAVKAISPYFLFNKFRKDSVGYTLNVLYIYDIKFL